MKILQVQIDHHGHPAWFDLMDVPETVNDLAAIQQIVDRAAGDSVGTFRIVELLEGEKPDFGEG